MDGSSSSKKWHWNCAGALCTNNWRNEGLEYYTVTPIGKRNDELKASYMKVLMNGNINWKKQVICSAHWSTGRRESIEDPSDVCCTEDYIKKLEKSKPRCANDKKRKARKLASIKRSSQNTPKAKRRLIENYRCEAGISCSEKEVSKNDHESIDKHPDNLKSENEDLRKQCDAVARKLEEKELEIANLKRQLKDVMEKEQKLEVQLRQLRSQLGQIQFTYANLIHYPEKFFYMTGLTATEFDCLLEAVEPFVHLMVYPDCKGSGMETKSRKLDLKTEMLCFFSICRHSLHLGVVSWMTAASTSTVSRNFCAWAVFLSSLFKCLELKPLPGFVEEFLPREFIEAGYADTEALGDATETWIGQSENFDINNITFSSYKNHTTGKTSVWIFPHGGLLQCSETYPGTISDSDITDQCGVLSKIHKGKVVLTDKGFNISDLCHSKGILHNRPPLKFSEQYEETEISNNFDIATLRIYNENYIGQMRDWTILNACWPLSRIDLLGHCFKIFAHIVNMLKTPVGPKNE